VRRGAVGLAPRRRPIYAEAPTMLFGDAKNSVTEVAEELKAL
jgi:NAD/NADP transhydrogenase beta subunit